MALLCWRARRVGGRRQRRRAGGAECQPLQEVANSGNHTFGLREGFLGLSIFSCRYHHRARHVRVVPVDGAEYYRFLSRTPTPTRTSPGDRK